MNTPKAPAVSAVKQLGPRLIELDHLVELLMTKTPVTFRVGSAPKNFVEVVTFAGTDVRVASALDAQTAIQWWLNCRMQKTLCSLN